MAKNLIVTADDYGVTDEINTGIEMALQNGWINSIAVLVNYQHDQPNNSLTRLKRFLEDNNLHDKVCVGIHFTISSGKPVSKNVGHLTTRNSGQFRSFEDFEATYDRHKVLVQVRKELEAQLDVFQQNLGMMPAHATSHHDTLTYFPGIFSTFLHVLIDAGNIPFRSPRFNPKHHRTKFDLFATRANLMTMARLDKTQAKVEKDRGVKVRMPRRTYAGNYGPIPPFKVRKKRKFIKMPWVKTVDELVDHKLDCMHEVLKDFAANELESLEIMLHLTNEGLKNHKTYLKEYKRYYGQYSGINPKYFDGRYAEMSALKQERPWEAYPELQLGGWESL